mmetsp:Transcript_12282/g.33611  ORF Transcript_12282/g.33611 Transcript_12282/m.33611 type:complete len:421 (-) Transcript_12282:1130-2392(-)
MLQLQLLPSVWLVTSTLAPKVRADGSAWLPRGCTRQGAIGSNCLCPGRFTPRPWPFQPSLSAQDSAAVLRHLFAFLIAAPPHGLPPCGRPPRRCPPPRCRPPLGLRPPPRRSLPFQRLFLGLRRSRRCRLLRPGRRRRRRGGPLGDAVVGVVDLLGVADREGLALAHQVARRGGVGIKLSVAPRVVHNAFEVVRCVVAHLVPREVRLGAGVALVIAGILRLPISFDVIPEELQVWTMAVVGGRAIGPLLLVVEAQGVSHLVDHVACVAAVAAPSEVDAPVGLPRADVGPASALVVVADADVWLCRVRGMLDQADASVVGHLLNGNIERFLARVGDVWEEGVADLHKLLPSALVLVTPRAARLPLAPSLAREGIGAGAVPGLFVRLLLLVLRRRRFEHGLLRGVNVGIGHIFLHLHADVDA